MGLNVLFSRWAVVWWCLVLPMVLLLASENAPTITSNLLARAASDEEAIDSKPTKKHKHHRERISESVQRAHQRKEDRKHDREERHTTRTQRRDNVHMNRQNMEARKPSKVDL